MYSETLKIFEDGLKQLHTDAMKKAASGMFQPINIVMKFDVVAVNGALPFAISTMEIDDVIYYQKYGSSKNYHQLTIEDAIESAE